MVALELLREHWMWAMIVSGGILSGLFYLAHYSAPEHGPMEGDADAGAHGGGLHEFPGGIQEGNLKVPAFLWCFFLIMFLFAAGYVLWIRFAVGSF